MHIKMFNLCINCHKNPEGPARIGVTKSGSSFVSRACEECQAQVDDVVLKEQLMNNGLKRSYVDWR